MKNGKIDKHGNKEEMLDNVFTNTACQKLSEGGFGNE